MDELIKLIDAVGRFLGATILPIVVLAIFWLFRGEINALIKRTNKVSVEGAGFKGVIDTQAAQTQASNAVVAAIASRPEPGQDAHATAEQAQAAGSSVAEVVTRQVVQRGSTATILWVDDNPDNNIWPRRSLEAIGIRFVLATSTEDGIDQAKRQRFDAVITDMGRGVHRTAGYDLIEGLRAAGVKAPVIIYAASTNAERRAEAKRRGAFDTTNRPDELFRLVLAALERTP